MENILKVKIVLFQRLITEKYFYVFFEHLKQTWRKFEEKNWNFFREAQFFFQKSSYSVILLIKFWKVKNSHNFVMGLFSARQNFRATERSKIATWAKNSPVWSHWMNIGYFPATIPLFWIHQKSSQWRWHLKLRIAERSGNKSK